MRDFQLESRPRSEIIEGGEEEGEDRKRKRRMSNSQKNSIPVVDDDLVVDQILTRLPVKSLIRFKCVCKAWKSIIEHDSHFIASHNAHSQARLPGLLMIPSWIYSNERSDSSFFSAELHCADDDSDGGRVITGATVHKLGGMGRIRPSRPIVKYLGPVRGLLCLAGDQFAVQIYNVSTCQAVTPWIRSPGVMKNEPDRCQFGFDPSTGKYKVVFMWENPAVCEVLTVGVDASWRRIDQVPPCNLIGYDSVYANGSIYWITYTGGFSQNEEGYSEFLMAFDVGSEKFRMIKIPRFTFWRCSAFACVRLVEMDGCLTVVRGRLVGAECDTAAKMWKFHDNDKLQGINRTSSSSIEAEQDWSEVTIKLPPSVDIQPEYSRWHPIPGKDLMIIETNNPPSYFQPQSRVQFPSFYCYNMINKTLSKLELQLPSSLLDSKLVRCAIFAECLFSVTSNLTYPAPPPIRPVPPRNVPGAFYHYIHPVLPQGGNPFAPAPAFGLMPSGHAFGPRPFG